jgi:biopolymer transport protein ExbD
MAISINGGGFGSRRRGGAALSEINVTPFVDVVLVLLIIFMLTAQVMEFGIEVDVPKVRMVKDTEQAMPVVTITKEGSVTLNGKPVNINDLAAVIHQNFAKTNGVYVRADKDVVWDIVAQVTAVLGQAKFQVNFVTKPEDTAARGQRR